MDNFIIGAIIVLSLWFVFSMRSKKTKSYQAFNTLDEAEVWLTNEGLKAISINFSSYNDPALMKNAGATIVVGSGDKADGSRLGFALEVIEGSGVVEIEYLEPYGIASHHRAASQTAKIEGMYLLDVLQEMAKQYRALHSR